MNNHTLDVDAQIPRVRTGPAGWIDRLTGPGATGAELVLQFFPAAVAAVVAPLYANSLDLQWHWAQLVLIGVLAADLVGGVLTNATGAAKRWFHRCGQGSKQHMNFVTAHFLHLALVALVFRAGDGAFFVLSAGFLLACATLILATPRYLQRPVALGLYALLIMTYPHFIAPTPGIEWFLPLFFLKLLVAHLVYEYPFRPADKGLSGGGAFAESAQDSGNTK